MFYRINYAHVALLIALGAMTASCSPSEPKSPSATLSTSPSSNVSDRDVNEHVKTSLDQNDSLKRFDIQVITLKGDVRLVGVVETQENIDEAVRIARAAEGTHSIHNELTLQK
jgi:osmotically-inducible protein OsmY